MEIAGINEKAREHFSGAFYHGVTLYICLKIAVDVHMEPKAVVSMET